MLRSGVVDELESLLSYAEHDYNSYSDQPDKTLTNATKLLLVNIFLLRILEEYR